MKKTISILTALLLIGTTVKSQEHIVVDGPYTNNGGHLFFIPLSEIDSLTYEEHTTKSKFFLSDILAEDKNISIYAEALKATGIDDSLHAHLDYNYDVNVDLTRWNSDRMITKVLSEYDNVAYPANRPFKFTAFVVKDQVLAEKYGITNLNGLRQLAASIYDEMYPEDAIHYDDMTDRRNSLNRFISYHILNRYGSYYTLTAVDGPNSTLAVNWNRNVWDISDWYETMMPHSLMKFSFPIGEDEGLYINRRGVQSSADERGVFVVGSKVYSPEEMVVGNEANNGIYYYINDIVHYGRVTQKIVLNERIRIDATTLSPDFMTSGARGHYTRFNYENGKYAGWDAVSNCNNRRTCLGFQSKSVENFIFSENTRVHVRPRTLNFWSYQGDDVAVISDDGEITFKLPSLPAGTYELRIGTCIGFNAIGIRQFILDGTVMRDSVDFRVSGTDSSIGWTYDDDSDATMRKNGWMKGPASYYPAGSEAGGSKGPNSFRNISNTLRCIIGTFTTDGKSDHYLTIKSLTESLESLQGRQFMLDYIELCPSSVYNSASEPEDIW